MANNINIPDDNITASIKQFLMSRYTQAINDYRNKYTPAHYSVGSFEVGNYIRYRLISDSDTSTAW